MKHRRAFFRLTRLGDGSVCAFLTLSGQSPAGDALHEMARLLMLADHSIQKSVEVETSRH